MCGESLELPLQAPDQIWVGDITYLKVGPTYRYLAVVMDKYSRRVVGWSYGPRKDVALTLRALNNAVRNRRPRCSVLFRSDRGTEYAASALNNAFIESFSHSMKADLYHGLRFEHDDQIRAALRSYVPFYNHERLHSSLQYVPPCGAARRGHQGATAHTLGNRN